MEVYKKLEEALLRGSGEDVQSLTQEALNDGIAAGAVLQKGLIPAFDEIGRRWDRGEVFIPEVLKSAKAVEQAMLVLRPLFTKEGVKSMGTIVLGTVKDDLHDIGKSIVKMMLEGAGFDVIDLGIDVSADAFVEEARKTNADIIALSALLSTTMPNMKKTIEVLCREGITSKVIVGGAPVTEEFAAEIGATGYASDAIEAVAVCRSWLPKS
jgi:5-methyltetrahydrofolate--homocysteine methyltransferase